MIDDAKLYTDIGNKLKTIRVEKKINQDQVAKKLSLSRTSIINFEKGNQRISLHDLFQYCEFLKIDITDVLPSMNDVSSHSSASVSEAQDKLKESPATLAVLEKYLLR
jgi:transcriptional regulator with XRE-family HTH domain